MKTQSYLPPRLLRWSCFGATVIVLLSAWLMPFSLSAAPLTLTPTPTPTHTPAPLAPADLLREGLRQQHNGNHAAARAAFSSFLAQAPADPQAADAAFSLGESYQADGLYSEAITAFEDFLRRADSDPRRAAAQFHLGQAYQALQEWEAARGAYQIYLQSGSPLMAYDVHRRLAEVAAGLQEPAAAAAAYQAAVSAAPSRVLALAAREQWAAYATARADHAGALTSYPAAIAAEPMPELPAVPMPADLAALFDACAKAGLYGDTDRAALPAMLALDAEGTRGLIEAMHSRIGRCRRCRHFRRPGLSDGYCVRRSDLRRAYGAMRALPSDAGTHCRLFDPGGA